MYKTTPFYERLAPLNETGLWSHWSGYLVSRKFQMTDKVEYFAVRNSAALFDTSPLYKYRITGADAERFLSGVLARDIRMCRDGQAQYTCWCDDRGYVVEDGVVFRDRSDDFMLTSAEPNCAYFQNLVGPLRVQIEDISAQFAALAVQGPRSRQLLSLLAPEIADLRYFHHTMVKLGDIPARVSRTGYTGDLGYELWVEAGDATALWDTIAEASAGYGVTPAGQNVLLMTRIEAGLVLIGADFHSSRFAYSDHNCSTPIELGFGWMFGGLATSDRRFVGRQAIERELAGKTSRWKTVGLIIDWQDWNRVHQAEGLIPPKDITPVTHEIMLYDDDGVHAGYTTSMMYSPMLQRHIAIGRVRPHLAAPGSLVQLETTIHHRYRTVAAHVAKNPLFNPARKTS
jgi:aminomethyltransferase